MFKNQLTTFEAAFLDIYTILIIAIRNLVLRQINQKLISKKNAVRLKSKSQRKSNNIYIFAIFSFKPNSCLDTYKKLS